MKTNQVSCPTCHQQVAVSDPTRWKVTLGSQTTPLATYDLVACNPREARDMAVSIYLAGRIGKPPITLPVFVEEAR